MSFTGSKPRVLFLHDNESAYLSASLFHGLRSVLRNNCVDFPRFDCMYGPLTDGLRKKSAQHGFTLFGLLQDNEELAAERFAWQYEFQKYDLFVCAVDCRWPNWGRTQCLRDLSAQVSPEKVVLIDGSDGPAIFPFAFRIMKRQPTQLFSPWHRHKYFKREFQEEGLEYGLQALPRALRKWLPTPANMRRISFSIPEEKIDPAAVKTKLFPRHIVDSEIASRIEDSVDGGKLGAERWAFSSEEEYYNDLKSSKYGITTKRAGWDCLRHYELASQGCVPCFRDLDKKPPTCAPHGLNAENSICYSSYADLMQKIGSIDEDSYLRMKARTLQWAADNSTRSRALNFLQESLSVDWDRKTF